jgi:hypothetical protein
MHECLQRLLVVLAIGTALSGAAAADMLKSTVKVKVIASGGQCDKPPDTIIPAPSAGGGQIERSFGPADFVVKGDRFAAQKGLGIFLRVRIRGYGPGREVTVMVEPPVGRTGVWEQPIGRDGELDFGRFPAIGEALPQGRYLLSVLDDGQYLFTYAITLEGEAEESLCVPVS